MAKTRQQLIDEIAKAIPIARKGETNLGFPHLTVSQYEQTFILRLKESTEANGHLST